MNCLLDPLMLLDTIGAAAERRYAAAIREQPPTVSAPLPTSRRCTTTGAALHPCSPPVGPKAV
jgi:hypothetical protein